MCVHACVYILCLHMCVHISYILGLPELEEDEAFVDQALLAGALPFFQVCVVESKSFHQEASKLSLFNNIPL